MTPREAKAIAVLKAEGLATKPAIALADTWLIKGDFLLTPLPFAFVANRRGKNRLMLARQTKVKV